MWYKYSGLERPHKLGYRSYPYGRIPIDPANLAAIGHHFQQKKTTKDDTQIWGDLCIDQKLETFLFGWPNAVNRFDLMSTLFCVVCSDEEEVRRPRPPSVTESRLRELFRARREAKQKEELQLSNVMTPDIKMVYKGHRNSRTMVSYCHSIWHSLIWITLTWRWLNYIHKYPRPLKQYDWTKCNHVGVF